ncbi:UDP-glycosyltransferase 74F2-like [Ipomoea triloba]|uniref:UDP-glycosyltransferase 74F2-like n=1 Tax=Ipomoea triloba TaxID=35885 RepID=UPI00125E2B14|nr:UDP-glycosyltransferase 74F2-like [Ipomoea triloba]
MEKSERGKGKHNEYKAHCLLLPLPAQGHINPILQFSKRLEAKGVKITIAITNFMLKTLQDFSISSPHVSIQTISDGFDEEAYPDALISQVYLQNLRRVGSQTLAQLLRRLRVGRFPVSCVVYDSFLPWALDVAKEERVMGACFFTQPCAVDAVYYYVHEGLIELPLGENQVIRIPGVPELEPGDAPSFVFAPESYPAVLEMLVNQFSNVEKADWILINTIYELEHKIIDWMGKLWAVRTVGPTIPSAYLDNRLPDDREYDLSMFKPMTEICMKWLDDQQDKSVIYVSFGSLVSLQGQQMEELAWGLWKSNKPFLWIVRSTEEANKLPENFVGMATEEGRGLVVTWCPQLQVLAHRSLGCFVTHCGWNSTLEAISLGVPMVAVPQWSDQITNAKLVMDAWKIGVRVKLDEKGVAKREEMEECIRRVMGEEEMRANMNKWKQVCREAMEEGGSSDRNIQDFVSCLVSKSMTN